MFDLKNFRENVLKLTQEEFANLIDVRQDNVSRMEKNPQTIDLTVLMRIAKATGTSLDELVGYKKTEVDEIKVENTWESIDFTRKTLVNYIQECIKKQSLKKDYIDIIQETKEIVEKSIVKPKVAFLGASDVGKSTIINALLGEDRMPTSWTPTTSISIYIKHINDKPNYINNNVCLYKSKIDSSEEWNVNSYADEEFHKKWFFSGGDIEILKKWAVRQGNNDISDEVGAAIVYLDSKVLEVCDLVDLPGFGTGDREIDDILANNANNFADVVVYMSLSNAFLRGSDLEFLKSTINQLPIIENKENNMKPLSNLFILASQAHTINKGNRVQLDKILDEGCKRLISQMPDEVWINRGEVTGYEYSYKELRERFFTYTIDIEDIRRDFEKDFSNCIELYPRVLKDKVIESVKDLSLINNISLDKDLEQYSNILNEREQYKQVLKELKENEPIRKNQNLKLRSDVLLRINNLNVDSKERFLSEYSNLISVDEIVTIIDDKGYKKKKEDVDLLVGYLSSKLQARLQEVLKLESSELNKIIDSYIKEYENAILKGSNSINIGKIRIAFDSKRSFASGLAGLATFGGLAVWASTLGNLGAYILVAKGVSLLAALGISIEGGVAGAAAFVAAIGGPVVLAVALAMIIALGTFALLGIGWKSTLAKKIIKEFSKNNVVDDFNKAIEKYWEDTRFAFNVAADNMESKYIEYMNDLEEMVNTTDVLKIEDSIRQANVVKDFFKYMPL